MSSHLTSWPGNCTHWGVAQRHPLGTGSGSHPIWGLLTPSPEGRGDCDPGSHTAQLLQHGSPTRTPDMDARHGVLTPSHTQPLCPVWLPPWCPHRDTPLPHPVSSQLPIVRLTLESPVQSGHPERRTTRPHLQARPSSCEGERRLSSLWHFQEQTERQMENWDQKGMLAQ